MKYESGRSLIEIIGVLAITAVMTAAAVGIYNSIRHNQKNTIAAAELRELAKNTKLLMEMRGDYTGVSVDYLVICCRVYITGILKPTHINGSVPNCIDIRTRRIAFVVC